jgi:hypothetical protein
LRSTTIALLALGTLTFLFALGPATPVFDGLLLLPEVGSFRMPWRILFITDFCFALCAAIGLQAILDRIPAAGEGRARTRWQPAALVGGAVVAAAMLEILLAPPKGAALPYDADDPLLSPYHERRAVLDDLAARDDRVWTWLLGDMGDVSDKLASLHRVRSISDVEIMTLRRQREYFTHLYWGELEPAQSNRKGLSQKIFYGNYNIGAPGVDVAAVIARSRLVELAAASHLLVPRTAIATPAVSGYLKGRGLRPVDIRDRQIVLFAIPDAMPRAIVTHALLPAPEPRPLLEQLGRADFDPRAASYIEGDPRELPAMLPNARPEWVRVAVDDLHEVALDARLDTPGFVVLADSFYPGWHAEVDGVETPIFATNHLFRGVAVPAGEHRIVFRYQPASVLWGSGLSVIGAALLGWLFVSTRAAGPSTRDAAS